MKKPVYFDYNATTPVDPRVLEVMLPYFSDEFGNSMSAAHAFGWNAEKAVELAREQVAQCLHCSPHEVIFTSGATEGNNWVVRGLLDKLRKESPAEPIEFISSPIEHSSVLRSMRWAETQGVKVHWLAVNSQGEINLKELEGLINSKTKLISLMWVNNEIGIINPMSEICNIARRHQIYLHSDSTQAVGKLPVHLQETPIDLMTFSAHKIYGPKGIGALVMRSQNPKVQIEPMMLGGGHEKGFRSGTVNVPGVVGLGHACRLIQLELRQETERIQRLQGELWNRIKSKFPQARLNGPPIGRRIHNNLNITFVGSKVPSSFTEFAISRGSACHSGLTSVSPVLKAIGLSDGDADKTLRFSLGRNSTSIDIQLSEIHN